MELNTIQTEGTWNEVAERLNDNFSKILLAIQNGAGGGEGDDGDSKIVTIELDPSKLVQGEEVKLTQEQRETLYLAREGYTVFTTCYMDFSGSIQPWGQVISCIQTYLGSSTHVNTITIVSRDGKNFDDANGLIVYTIDIFDDYSGFSHSKVTSIIRLSDINNKVNKDEVYSKDEMSLAITREVTDKTRDFYTRSEVKEMYALKEDVTETVDNAVSAIETSFTAELKKKQNALVSGTNIKTLNGQSILGSGDIDIGGGEGTITEIQANGTRIATSGVANIPAASTSKYGVTKLSSSYTSTSVSLAATPYAVNKVYEMVQKKQDAILDIDTIRANASRGATAVQPDEVYSKEETSKAITREVTETVDNAVSAIETSFTAELKKKQNAETGKGLSTNDYTTEDKTKLAGIADGAEVNVQSDWNVTDASSDAYIKNKPTIPSAVTESTVFGWGFTKNKGTVTGVKLNGSTYIPSSSNGVVDLGSISSEGGGGELNVVAISLDVTKLTAGNYVTITKEQYDQLLLSRKGYPVVIADANFSGNYAYDSEWGQVISCYRQYFASSAFVYRLSVIHHAGDVYSNTPNTQIYTMEVMDMATGGGSSSTYLYVRAIKNLY